jgi:hypothetical protein
MNSLWNIRIFLGLVPQEPPGIRPLYSSIQVKFISSIEVWVFYSHSPPRFCGRSKTPFLWQAKFSGKAEESFKGLWWSCVQLQFEWHTL